MEKTSTITNRPDVENTSITTNHPDVENVVSEQAHAISTVKRRKIGKKVVKGKSQKTRLGWGKKEAHENEMGWSPGDR